MSVFPFFSKDFRASLGIKNPCFFGGFPCLFPKKNQGKEGQGSQGPPNGGVSNEGGFPIWTCPSFFVLFCPFWDFPDFSGIFPICSGMVRGFSRFVPSLFLGLLRAPTRNSPERVRDTIWTFPPKKCETPRFSFSQGSGRKKSRKIPVKFPAKYPCKKSRKNHRRASAGAQGEQYSARFLIYHFGAFTSCT